MRYWSACKLLLFIQKVSSYDFTRTYELEQDEDTGTYYMDMFMGTKLENVHLLIDTQANGTAIKYDAQDSRRSIIHHNKRDMVEMPDGKAEGYEITDELCLDRD